MKSKFVVLAITTLVIGVMVVGCVRGIDGTWVGVNEDDDGFKFIFNNGNFEASFDDDSSDDYSSRGTYTIDGKNITMTFDDGFATGIISGNKLTVSYTDDDGEIHTITCIKKQKNSSKNKALTGSKALVGTWEGIGGITWTFTGNKFTQNTYGVKTTFPYKIKGNSISTKYMDVEVEMEFEIDGDTLTIEVMGFDMKFKRVKK